MSGVDSGVLLYEKTKSMPSTYFALNPKLTHFVGLENFSTIFKDDLFTTAFGNTVKAIPHKERLATLHAICLQIFRHISQKCS